MLEFRYPLSVLVKDYLLGVLGLAVSAQILSTTETGSGLFWFFIALTVFFLIVTANAANRHVTRITVSEDGIASGPWMRRFIAWNDLKGLSLRFYAVRSVLGRNKGGWMTLKLKSGQGSITVDSDLPHFQSLVTKAALMAKENGVLVDAYTAHNLLSLGIEVPA
ncbi:MAG: hypothetical protein IPK59_12475 [Rhodospirillaceae bacterium]|nr:hypothetical protein [Rhodospirillaceae bacterium]